MNWIKDEEKKQKSMNELNELNYKIKWKKLCKNIDRIMKKWPGK